MFLEPLCNCLSLPLCLPLSLPSPLHSLHIHSMNILWWVLESSDERGIRHQGPQRLTVELRARGAGRGGGGWSAQPSQGLEEATFYSKSQKMAFLYSSQEDTFCLACLCFNFFFKVSCQYLKLRILYSPVSLKCFKDLGLPPNTATVSGGSPEQFQYDTDPYHS